LQESELVNLDEKATDMSTISGKIQGKPLAG